MKNHLHLAKQYWGMLLQAGDLAIDATCGNGHDTLFLAGLCQVVGLDIQPEALEKTRELLTLHQTKADLFLLSHAHIDTLPLEKAPKLIVYNLGYLPGGNKALTTLTPTTLDALRKSANLLAPGGALSITCYPGHEEGFREEQAVEQWVKELPSSDWSICHHRWLNATRAPSLFWVFKLEKSGFTDPRTAE